MKLIAVTLLLLVFPASSTRTTEVLGAAVLDVVSEHIRDCTGADGQYYELDVLAQGPMTSGDARLSGDASARIHGLIKRDGANLIGPAVDELVIRDPAGGSVKARGTAYTLVDGAAAERGFLLMRLADGATLYASLSESAHGVAPAIVDHNLRRQGLPPSGARGPIVLKFGGRTPAANVTDIAFVQSGRCSDGSD